MDGCRGGWLVCRLGVQSLAIDLIAVARSLADVLACEETATHLAIDIPIGLPEIGLSRHCDLQARQLLTKLRSNSVFPAPSRDLTRQLDYSDACAHSQAICGKGISKQAHAIFPKIAEVDEIMTSELQDRVFEVHPELCFWGLAGRPMQHGKKNPDGYQERSRILTKLLSTHLPERAEVRQLGLPIEPDDLLDALVAAFTAYRAWKGNAIRIPANPQLDRKGLRMEMVY
jgi:predicted RNase H-like nuclease